MNVIPSVASVSVADGNYLSGFGNGFETEALPGALPVGRNSPQKCPYGLYAEQLSGSPFTAPRASNERSWLYRVRPTIAHWGRFRKADIGLWRTAPASEVELPIAPLRWDPIPIPNQELSFLEGVRSMTTAGFGSILETTQGGKVAVVLQSGEEQRFLEDGDEVILLARAEREGFVPIGFGECRAVIVPAPISGKAAD